MTQNPVGSARAYQGEALVPSSIAGHAGVRRWLFVIAALIAGLILVGGATRLTDSGLSITEWRPITGIVPPLGDDAWLDEFIKYQGIPEYQYVNQGMTLDEFKHIYWWEWAHRTFARIIGVAFLLPLIYFAATRRVDRALGMRLGLIFLLGAGQGFLGWFMVQSGLTEGVDVSQYRLAAHLSLAFLILGAVLWTAFGIGRSISDADIGPPPGYRRLATWLLALVFLQIAVGGFVAGLDAGLTYNTWPLMDNAFIPDGLMIMSPWYLNLFENVLTVQFNHRMLAYFLVALTAIYAVSILQYGGATAIGRSALWLLAALFSQAALGVITVLTSVPLPLGLAHQAGAIVVFAVAIHHLFLLTRPGATSPE